ncbi:hypothetical protein ACWC09_43505 [Streptomyces sp. NPDC001617]
MTISTDKPRLDPAALRDLTWDGAEDPDDGIATGEDSTHPEE